VHAHLEHFGQLGHWALVEHQLQLREDGGGEAGHLFHEEKQLVEQLFEEGLVHHSGVLLVGQQISQNSEAVLSRLGQISQDGDGDDCEGAAPYGF
jgi:hypothetical protein